MLRDWIFVPVVVQMMMTLWIYVRLVNARVREYRAGRVDKARVPLHPDAWPDNVIQINNNLRNQFELPVLFYVLSVVLWLLDAVNPLALAAATAFVLSRIVHAVIHLGSNYVPNRRRAFTVGWWAIAAMALILLWVLARRFAGL